MKKQYILFFITILVAQNIVASDTTCNNFHKGKFYYNDSLNNKVLVTRKNKRQIEYNEGTTVTTVLKIKWINECEYTLKQIWSDSKAERKHNNRTSTTIMKPIDENTYEYNCGCKVEMEKAIKGIMKRDNKIF
jgi:hypothetical protein